MTRQAEILELLQEQSFASVTELSKRFNVNPSTVRRDLGNLAKEELIQRTRGGAMAIKQLDTPSRLKESLHKKEKAAIGRAMADRIQDGQTVLLDSGSTTLEIAKHLHASRLTVVTNDLRIGLEIADRQSANLVFIGGELLPNVFTLWGPTSVQQIEHLRVDIAIFGADAVDESGIYNTSSYEIELKRTMRRIAKEAFFVADSSKFGREALFHVFDLDSFTAGTSDSFLSQTRASRFPVPITTVNIASR